MKKLNKFTFLKVKKFHHERGHRVSKKNKIISDNFSSFYYISLASIFLVSFFYLIPLTVNFYLSNFTDNEIVVNSSNKNFNKVLEGKEIESLDEGNEKADFKNLYYDVLDMDINEKDTVRLSASTIDQLFKDENYNLKDIRKNKLVKPINIDLLPNEIKLIENTRERKELFIQIILPLILEENKKIRLERKTLFSILNKNNNSEEEKNWLKSKFKQYGVTNRDLATLKIRMDEVPVSLAIAQAAKETGWGTSRFAQEGNALFGQWTYSGDGIKPAGSDSDDTHKVMKFKILKASVRAYQRNLNTHKSYREFRKVRAIQRDVFGTLNSIELVNYLDKYAETGKEYIKILKKIIEQNKLKDFDDAKILPSSIKEKSLI